MRFFAAAVAGLVAAPASAGIVITTAPETGLGQPLRLTLERRLADGGPDVSPVALSVLLSSDRGDAGGFAANGPQFYRVWDSSISVLIAGNSATVGAYFRGGTQGLATLYADAGATGSTSLAVDITPSLFVDDFETGAVEPALGWSPRDVPPSLTRVSDAGAHRGAYGLRMIDTDTTLGPGPQGAIENVPLFSDPHELYFRTWQRFTQVQGTGHVYLAAFAGTGNGEATWGLDLPQQRLTFMVRQHDDTYARRSLDAGTLQLGDWHLIEMAVDGFGTTTGRARLYLDGALLDDRGPVDWSQEVYERMTVGEHYADNRDVTLITDYDDVRMSTVPLASTLHLVAPSQARVGECAQFELALVDSLTQAAATAPYEVLAIVDGGASPFLDARCSIVAGGWLLAAGTSTRSMWARFDRPGPAVISVEHLDFLSATAAIDVLGPADAGNPTLRPLQVGCGCSASSGPLGVAVLLGLRRLLGRAVTFR